MFQISEDDGLPKSLCHRCVFNLENFYDFRTACVNAVDLLRRCQPREAVSVSISNNKTCSILARPSI